MAYTAENLSVVGYANGFTVWHYTGKDRIEDMLTPGYFDLAHQMLRVGDLLVMNGTGGFGASRRMHVLSFVTDSGGNSVTIQEVGSTRPAAAAA